MSEKPTWLKNAKKVIRKPKKHDPKEKIRNKKKIANVLEAAKMTIVTADDDPTHIVDAIEDPEDCHEEMKMWMEGRALSVSARWVRDNFVIEFLKDFNGVEAATRCGSSNPVAMWRRMMKCPYTQRAISKKMQEWEADAVVSRNKLCATLWREANDFIHGTAATRVAAAAKLGKMMGYEVDNINLTLNQNQEFIDAPLTKEEFIEMNIAFEEEF